MVISKKKLCRSLLDGSTRNVLVVAFWSGEREYMDSRYAATGRVGGRGRGRGYFLRRQVETLSSIKHSLSLIVFVAAELPGGGLHEEFAWEWDRLPECLGPNDTELVLYTRPNGGMSYGSLLYAFERLRREGRGFDHYFFTEDDYLFVIDDFDRKLLGVRAWYVDRFGVDCDYLCGRIVRSRDRSLGLMGAPIAAISSGVLTARALRFLSARLAEPRNGYLRGKLMEGGSRSQVVFSNLFDEGMIYSFEDFYGIEFRGRRGIERYGVGRPLLLTAATAKAAFGGTEEEEGTIS